MSELVPETAKQKLAVSRARLLAAMGYGELEDGQNVEPGVAASLKRTEPSVLPAWYARLGGRALASWWRDHPVNSALELATPLLESYGARHPAKLVAYGAGFGTLVVLLRPWSLLSAATIAALLVRSTDLSGALGAVMRGARGRPGPSENRLDRRPR